jgi:hypothetical protein
VPALDGGSVTTKAYREFFGRYIPNYYLAACSPVPRIGEDEVRPHPREGGMFLTSGSLGLGMASAIAAHCCRADRSNVWQLRALLKNASVLVLDEATSALDTESERPTPDSWCSVVLSCNGRPQRIAD